MLGLGRVGDPARGRQTFERYVEDTWFPNHQVEVTTRQVYWYCLRKHILPEFGPMKMVEILPEHVREWVTKMKDWGLSPAMVAGEQGDPQRDLHDRAERSDHVPAPVQGGQDADG